jgi:hypothetical protein
MVIGGEKEWLLYIVAVKIEFELMDTILKRIKSAI